MIIRNLFDDQGKIINIKMGSSTEKEVREEEEKQELRVFESEEYFNVKDIMEWLPYKAGVIRKYLRKGKIEGRKLGKTWSVSRLNLYNYLGGK